MENDIDRAELTPELSRKLKLYAKAIRRALHTSTYYWNSKEPDPVPPVTSRIAQRFLVEDVGSMLTACMILALYAVVRIFMVGMNLDLLLLIIGSILSIVSAFIFTLYILKCFEKGKPGVFISLFMAMVVGYIPFLFALYVIFYKGLYFLITDFSLSRAFKSIAFVLAGHWTAKKIREVKEFHCLIVGQLENLI